MSVRSGGAQLHSAKDMPSYLSEKARNRHHLQIFKGALLRCIFKRNSVFSKRTIWFRTIIFKATCTRFFNDVVLCNIHPEAVDGCHCLNPLNRGGVSSSFRLTCFKRDATLELMNIMSLWPEFVRWRNFMDGPISCSVSADLYILHCHYDQEAVAEHIRTFECS